jgi:hypothetical protein
MRNAIKLLTTSSILQAYLSVLILSVRLFAQGGMGPGPGTPHTTGAAVTWTLAQVPRSNFTCTATSVATLSCSPLSVTAIGAGDTLVLTSSLFMNANGPGTFSSASGGGETWTHCPSQANHQGDGTGQLQTDCAYVLAAVGGGTTFTFTWGNLTAGGFTAMDVALYDIKRSTGTASLETSQCGANTATSCTAVSASCTTCAGPTPTVTSTDFVAAWNAVDPGCSAVAAPYNVSPTALFDTSNVGGSFAGALSQTSGTSASWTCTASSPAAMAAIAFK